MRFIAAALAVGLAAVITVSTEPYSRNYISYKEYAVKQAKSCPAFCKALFRGADNFQEHYKECCDDAKNGEGECFTCGPRATFNKYWWKTPKIDACKVGTDGAECCSDTEPNCCKNECTNYATDVDNCGACGHTCNAGKECKNGRCIRPACPTAQKCGKKCCGAYQTCTNKYLGKCEDVCAPANKCGTDCCTEDERCYKPNLMDPTTHRCVPECDNTPQECGAGCCAEGLTCDIVSFPGFPFCSSNPSCPVHLQCDGANDDDCCEVGEYCKIKKNEDNQCKNDNSEPQSCPDDGCYEGVTRDAPVTNVAACTVTVCYNVGSTSDEASCNNVSHLLLQTPSALPFTLAPGDFNLEGYGPDGSTGLTGWKINPTSGFNAYEICFVFSGSSIASTDEATLYTKAGKCDNNVYPSVELTQFPTSMNACAP